MSEYSILRRNYFYFEKTLAWRKDRKTSHRLIIKLETRAATKMFVAIYAQKRLELTVDFFNFCRRRNRHEGDNPNGNTQTNNSNHDNLNINEVDEINNATNSHQNNENENRENFYLNGAAGMQFANELSNAYEKIINWKRNLSYVTKWSCREKLY